MVLGGFDALNNIFVTEASKYKIGPTLDVFASFKSANCQHSYYTEIITYR